MLIAVLMMQASISTDDLRREFQVSPHDMVIVHDAISKWSMREKPSEQAMKNRFPIVFRLPHKRCVVLWLRVPSVGMSPSYCYDLESDHFIEASDKGE